MPNPETPNTRGRARGPGKKTRKVPSSQSVNIIEYHNSFQSKERYLTFVPLSVLFVELYSGVTIKSVTATTVTCRDSQVGTVLCKWRVLRYNFIACYTLYFTHTCKRGSLTRFYRNRGEKKRQLLLASVHKCSTVEAHRVTILRGY